ncbi:unnamed protein product [Mytilus edulis]|uniref:DUF1758 domain-containing protein n=1 Tax=Mytilus edulis TaxID=6550 RepID=A0A8S3R507_MYTED|nr:unnamed protein product [Mytilus edulis]
MQLLLLLLIVVFVSTRKTTLDLNPQTSALVARRWVTGDETVQSLTTQQVADEDMNDKYYFDFVASDKRHLKEQLNTLQLDSYEYEQSISVLQSVKVDRFADSDNKKIELFYSRCYTPGSSEHGKEVTTEKMAVSYLKGLCTRYNNLLAKELDKSGDIIAQGIQDESVTTQLRQVLSAERRLKDFAAKLEDSMKEISLILEEKEDKEGEIVKFTKASEIYFKLLDGVTQRLDELKIFEEEIQDKITDTKKTESATDHKVEHLLQLQTQMQEQILQFQQLQLQELQRKSQPSTSASNQTTHLRRLYDDLERHLRSLDAMHQDVTQDVFISMITSKLPKKSLFNLKYRKVTMKDGQSSDDNKAIWKTQAVEIQWFADIVMDTIGVMSAESSVQLKTGSRKSRTAQTTVSNTEVNETEVVRLLMDSGSQRTYITENLANRLNLKKKATEEITLVTFGADKPKTLRTQKVSLKIRLKMEFVCSLMLMLFLR